jgi:hypothetical protein
MSKKSKAKRAEEGWKRLFDDLIKHKDLNRFFEKQSVYTKIYGEMSGLLFYTTRYYVFHELIVPEWLSSSNIKNRNRLYDMTKKVFGDGLANELQRISSKRTW